MSDESYNGWTNRETWAVSLHINNDQGWQESVLEALRADMADPDGYWTTVTSHELGSWRAGEVVKEKVEEVLEGLAGGWGDSYEEAFGIIMDIGSLWRVNWTELGAAFLSDLDES